MVSIPLGTSSYTRTVSGSSPLLLQNRYYEVNPANQENQVALITRPGFLKWLTVSSDPINNIFHQPGSFNDSLFVVAGSSLYRVASDEVVTTIASGVLNDEFGTNGKVAVKMAATARIGSTPEYLWIADGKHLWVYADSNSARGTITATAIVGGDKVQIGTTYYQFTGGVVDTGTPDGTSSNPWLVSLGSSLQNSIDNLRNAVNDTGVSGVDYSTAVLLNPDAFGFTNGTTTLTLYAKDTGSGGNSVTTSIIVGLDMTASGAHLTGGGTPGLAQVYIPDDVPPIDLTFIAGYIVIVMSEGYGVNGRFYWAGPGDLVIDPLNFATAERSPDTVYCIKTIEDQFWLFGPSTTEIWYPTGNFDTPFLRLEGKLFNKGIWPGTELKIKDFIMVVDTDGSVYAIQSSPQKVSDNSVEEIIRKAFAAQILTDTPIRSWGYSIDGHDFYILFLPDAVTLVYDLSTQQWSRWSSSEEDYLNQHVGLNWTTMKATTYSRGQESNIVAGDLRSGVLWLVDPALGYDENISTGAVEPFLTKVTGGLTTRGREVVPCSALTLAARMGDPKVDDAVVVLRTSDDEGQTWVTYDPLDVEPGNYFNLIWRSLGLIKSPGRLFEISDNGGMVRIDGLDMNQ